MDSTFLSRFPKQLGHWTIHGICNSLPSFIIALVFLHLWKSPQAVAAMLLAIAIFVVVFAVVTSLPWPFSDRSHVLGRAVRLGAKIRSWIAVISLPLALTPALALTPDFWCGFAAAAVQNEIFRALHVGGRSTNLIDSFGNASFLPVFTTTMLEGFIISFMLLMISFFCVMFLQSRERKKLFKAPSEVRCH
jgi:hypothetical protein